MAQPHDPECIFCKIAAGQLPSTKIHEDEHVLAFMDISPLSRGHALVIPKGHYARLDDMPADAAAACGAVLPKLGKALCAATKAKAWNLLQNNGKEAGQLVMHVHFHLIPRVDGSGLPFQWPAGREEPELLEALAEQVRKQM